ncbi:MAG: hypothetical protein HPY50_09540, partial [Firmicutes bacterium]|nr:hypothetical protein [Bacillota bacterium]
MKMKRFLGIVMMASLLFSLLPAGVSSAENSVEGTDQAVKFTIGQKSYNAGGRLVETDVAPYIKSLADGGGRTMVPVAFVAPALGAETPVWFPGERAVEIRKGQNLIRITIGSKELVVDGKKVQMDVAAEIKDLGTGGGRTMLPIAFVAKALGVGYEWDGAASSVTFFGYTKTYDLEGVYGPASGTQTIEGSVEVKADGVTLQNMVIRGNLTICEEVGAGNVTLNNIVVKGDTFVRGGGKDSIHINGGQYSSFSIQNVDGQVRIVAKDVNGLEVVISENAKGQEIILEGRFDSVVVDAQDVNITTQSQTTIGEVQVGANGTGATITLGQNTVVDKMVLDSQAEVKGSGTVKDAEVNADGVKFDKAPEKQSGTKPVSVSTPPPTTPPASGGGGGGGGGGGNTDTTAPEFAATYPKAGSAQAAGSKQVEILVQVNEAGTAYYVVVANNADAPSAAQVMAGNDSTDGAALDAANAAVVADTEESFVTAALPTDATAYDVYVVVKDGSNNTTAASKVDVTTPAAADVTAPTVTFNPADGAIDVPIAGDITITFSEAVRNLDDSAIQAADLATMLTLKETNAGGADVDFTASINAGRTVITIDPDADLLNGQACYVAIAAAVEDASDNVIAAADATFTTAEALSSDASLTSVAGQTDGTPGAQTGENPVNAITWEINVANAQADLVLADIAVAADATANLYLNADFAAGEIIGADTMPLAVGDTTAYIKVTAQDGSAKHYAVTITRAAAWDETAPEFAATYPKAGAGQAAGSRQVEILVQVNEAGTAYYVVVADGADAPSAAQIMAGNDSTDGAALDAGDAAVAADTEESFVTAALPADNTDYDVYVVVKDGSNNATGATKVDVITPVAAEDVTAPEFAATYPKAGAGQAAGSRQVEILVQVNEAGTAYYVVVADGADTPSAAQVTAGNDSTDGAALDAASAAVAADTEESFVTAALPADNTDYDVYVVVKDGSNNATGATKVDVITPVAAADVTAPEVEGLSPADDAANAAIDANLVVTFSENVDAVGGKNIYIKKSADDSTLATIAATDAQVTVNGSEATVNPD